MGRKVIISPSAEADLSDIVGYVARHNPEAALKLGNRLIERCELLGLYPEIGRTVPEFRRPDIRELVYRSYRIIYRVREGETILEIVRIWHAARGFPQIPSV